MKDASDQVVVDLARDLVSQAAPHELPLFAATSAAYLAHPQDAVGGDGDQALGFGVEAAAAFLTPAALLVASEVVTALRAALGKSAERVADDAADGLLDRILHRGDVGAGDPPATPAALSRDQLVAVRDAAIAKAKALGISSTQADMLGDALAGKLAIGA
jgi:hypothetical protein